MWNTPEEQRAFDAVMVGWTALCAVTIGAFALISAAAPAEVAAQPEVLLVQHTYDGPMEQAGTLVRWQYTGGHMLVEWVDTTADGIFRNSFEG